MSRITEIAPDIFQLTTYVAAADLQFNQFLIRDDEPLLYHTGQNSLFGEVSAAVASLVDLDTLRWIGFSHFEADECGSLNRWLDAAPHATPLAGIVAAATCINDFATRKPRVLEDNATFTTGRHALRFLATPYVPHNWESSLLFDATQRVLFSSDVLLQHGNPPPVADGIVERALGDFTAGQRGPFHDAIPWTTHTAETFARLAALDPHAIAIMHGASLAGDGAAALRSFSAALGGLLTEGRPQHS